MQDAKDPSQAEAKLRENLSRLGDTLFQPLDVALNLNGPRFVPASQLNALRRDAVERLEAARAAAWHRLPRAKPVEPPVNYPEDTLTYLANVFNHKARDFYAKHGVKVIAAAYESHEEEGEVSLMITKHCVRFSLSLCPKQAKGVTGVQGTVKRRADAADQWQGKTDPALRLQALRDARGWQDQAQRDERRAGEPGDVLPDATGDPGLSHQASSRASITSSRTRTPLTAAMARMRRPCSASSRVPLVVVQAVGLAGVVGGNAARPLAPAIELHRQLQPGAAGVGRHIDQQSGVHVEHPGPAVEARDVEHRNPVCALDAPVFGAGIMRVARAIFHVARTVDHARSNRGHGALQVDQM